MGDHRDTSLGLELVGPQGQLSAAAHQFPDDADLDRVRQVPAQPVLAATDQQLELPGRSVQVRLGGLGSCSDARATVRASIGSDWPGLGWPAGPWLCGGALAGQSGVTAEE